MIDNVAIVASASTFTGNSPEFSLRADTSGVEKW